MLCLHGDGQLHMTMVEGVGTEVEQDAVHVLTEVGDIAVPVREPLLTTGGPVLAADLVDMTVRSTVKIEVVQPSAILRATPANAFPAQASPRAALEWLGRTATAVPSEVPPDTLKVLVELFKKSGLDATLAMDSRWIAWSWQGGLETTANGRPSAQAMLALTAWVDAQSRTVLHDRTSRSALLMAMVLDGLQPKVSWTPAYAPVECRIAASPSSMTFAKIVSATRVREVAVDLVLARTGAVVSSQHAVGRLR